MNQPAVISYEVPAPERTRLNITSYGSVISLNETIDKILPGGSFVVDACWMRKRAVVAGSRKGVKLRSEKEGAHYRVWRHE